MAKPYAPLNEWLSLMTKAPGSRSFSRLIAATQIFIAVTGCPAADGTSLHVCAPPKL